MRRNRTQAAMIIVCRVQQREPFCVPVMVLPWDSWPGCPGC
jgi:hypothetical protein